MDRIDELMAQQELPGEDRFPQRTILDEAARLVSGPRRKSYDHPLPNHQRIADLWNAYMAARPAEPLTACDVVRMMILLKLARDVFTPKRDNLVDIAGYAACLEQMDEQYRQ